MPYKSIAFHIFEFVWVYNGVILYYGIAYLIQTIAQDVAASWAFFLNK